ncbi:MAG: S8 family serine peptidase, partial [Actinomycetes bacterium]
MLLAAVLAALMLVPAASAASLGHHPTSVLVTFEKGVSASKRASLHDRLNTRAVTSWPELRTQVVVLPKGLDAGSAVRRFE